MEHLTVPVIPIDWEWFINAEGTRPTAINPETYLSLARYARQNYDTDISPVVREYVILNTPDESGNDVLATVQYNSRGHVSSVGGHLDQTGHIVWECYAD